jgi:hypothetical protein
MSEESNNSYFLLLKQNMLRFAPKLAVLDNVFLKDFSKYLLEMYKGDSRKENIDNDWRMDKLEEFISHIYLLPKAPTSFQNRGSALLGETPFDKLAFTRAFLENYGCLEYANDDITINRYVVIDCEGKAKKYKSLEKFAMQYKDVPFVIFNNCENILKNVDNLILFKHLIEGNRGITISKGNNAFEDYIINPIYILLGKENKIHEIIEKTKPKFREYIRDRIFTFSCFIWIFDFDEEPTNI